MGMGNTNRLNSLVNCGFEYSPTLLTIKTENRRNQLPAIFFSMPMHGGPLGAQKAAQY